MFQLYEDLFETTFLRETGRYYHQEALKLLDVCTCSEYMEKASGCIHSAVIYSVCGYRMVYTYIHILTKEIDCKIN